jgi:biopolymer transport protein TolR
MNIPRAREGVRSEINVTPLVDVCLVLLIIFMVITPMLRHEVPVQLPETENPGRIPEISRQLTVSMEKDGTVWVDSTPVPLAELPDALRRLRSAGPDRTVIVEGDRRLRYEQISRMLEKIEEAGFRSVGLITEKRSDHRM